MAACQFVGFSRVVAFQEKEPNETAYSRTPNADAVVTTEDGGPVAQEGLVNVNVTDVVVQAPISIAANVCDVTVAVLVSRLEDGASPCDAAATAEAITPADGSLPELPTDSVLEELPVDSVVEELPITVPEFPVTLPTDS